ncbi:MAG: hypothetical protein IJT96_02245 [Lachnospiraceae bacterium]|nr:hypothetical protein [Lachnospiraceae bacterium]
MAGKMGMSMIILMYKKIFRTIRISVNTISPLIGTILLFYRNFGRIPDLDNPKDINEKIQFLKLTEYCNNPTIFQCVDKYGCREYLTNKGYADLLPQNYGLYTDARQINWKDLPDKFIVKCTHGSGYNIICDDKNKLETDKTIQTLNRWLKEDYWREWGELQYKDVKHRIIVDEYLGIRINTYKFYCFNGEPKVMYLSSWGENGEYDKYYDYYDMDWKHLDVRLEGHQNSQHIAEKPDGFERMKAIARDLSGDFKFVRIDLYNINGKIYFSEFTFVPTGGFMKLTPEECLYEWGSWLEL